MDRERSSVGSFESCSRDMASLSDSPAASGADSDGAAALRPISEREFELYAMALRRGPNFASARLLSTWASQRVTEVGCTFHEAHFGYGFLALRRCVDHRFGLVEQQSAMRSHDDALEGMRSSLRIGQPPNPLPPGERRRPLLFDLQGRTACPSLKLLTGTLSHWPAMRVVGELYLSMPKPDPNFVSDLQTANFDARLWELYLFACFREQGILVTQDVPSPDFRLEAGPTHAYVEAVTANSPARVVGFPPAQHAPTDRTERLAGETAARFAKTLRSKLARAYEQLPHVRGVPFAIALADFHAPSSMVWSREALPTYLYGVLPVVREGPSGKYATSEPLHQLRGRDQIPAGLFLDPTMKGLSAVLFSNAGTLGKFNRMGFLAGFRPPGLGMRRSGLIYDRRPGALEPIDFDMDVLSSDYSRLWPGGEAWCQELEVFHNPRADKPFDFDLLPGATHWFLRDGEIVCQTVWKNSVLASITHLLMN
jgi:hypothetical protein